MAHMVFKKPLLDQSTRETYLKQRQELRKAKELGFIDGETYQKAKKDLLPQPNSPVSTSSTFDLNSNAKNEAAPSIAANQRSRMSSSTSSSGSTMGSVHYPTEASLPNSGRRKTSTSILQQGNVATALYSPDAQSEEDREILRLRRKAQKALVEAERFERLKSYQKQLRDGDQDGTLDPSRFDQLTLSPELLTVPTNDSTITSSTSSVSGRSMKSQRMNFNIFRKRSASISRGSPPLFPPPNAPPIPLLQRTSTVSSTISSSSSSLTRRHGDARGGGREAILDALPMNFADIFLIRPSPASTTLARPPSRRHSFSSQHSRPSVSISRRSIETPDLIIRKAREEYVFESRPVSPVPLNFRSNTPLEEKRPQVSTVLRDIFISLLQDFEDTTILFSYPKYGKIKRVSYTSSLRSVVRSVKEDEERGAECGEGSFFLDESAGIQRSVLERQVWFLMAMKWLSFGRVLFSPGHHLIELSGDVGIAMGVSESSILDLDGAATADYSWHLAEEYPFTTIYNVLLPHSPRPQRNSAFPPNVHHITAPTLSNISALPANSIDVIISHNLSFLLLQHKNKTTEELIQLIVGVFRECARVLKPHGYFEMTIVDPVMNNMGPRTKAWIAKHIPLACGMRPSKIILVALERLGGAASGNGVLFDEVKECWVWMPTTSIGDELSTVTSTVGRHLYDHLYTPADEDDKLADMMYGVKVHREFMIWKDDKIVEECQKENTAFRWLKCYARKV